MLKIRYYGPVGQVTGYGLAASDLCMALSRHPEVDLQIVPLQAEASVSGRFLPLASRLRRRGDRDLAPDPDVVIVHTLPKDCRRVLEVERLLSAGAAPAMPAAGAMHVAYTTWEAQGQSPVVSDLQDFDQIWSPSHASLASLYSAELESAGNMPVRRLIPHCFDEAAWQERVDRHVGQLRDESRFSFYYIGATSSRKNLQGLLRAWAFAFSEADTDVILRIVAPANDAQRAALLAQTGLKVNEMAPIEWRSGISDAEIQDLHWNTGDCFVTATRGEAWNLPAFDAMLARRHVLSPWGLGSDDFLKDTTAELYNASSAPAYVDIAVNPPGPNDPPGSVNLRAMGAQGMTSRCLWREPDLVDLGRRMQSVRVSRQRSLNLKYNPPERYGYEVVANLVVDTLTQGTQQ